MTGPRPVRWSLFVLPLLLLMTCALSTIVGAQGLPQIAPSGVPSNQHGFSPGGDAIPFSSGMLSPFLPKIPNLELGFLYSFGNYVRTGRFTADYVLPFRLSTGSVFFGEAHAEGWDFRQTPSGASNNRIDLSLGGGYRTMLGRDTLMGVNAFYDTSRLYSRWYSSGGIGLEYAAKLAGDDAIDLNFNWYGNLFNRDVLVNAFRNQGNSFDVEAGYSHSLFDQSLDLRLKFAGYQFDVGNAVYGWRTGADLTTKNGMFTLRYEYGSDRLNGQYNTVGGFVNVGFELERLARGESPFSMPEPVFKSPRNLARMLTQKVRRNWHQPSAVIVAQASERVGSLRCATDQVLDNVAMTPVSGGLGFGTAAPVLFVPVPAACLQAGSGIVVEIDYSTTSLGANSILTVIVSGTSVFNSNSLIVANGASLTASVPLTIPANRQDAFIAAGDSPTQIGIVFFDFFMTAATVPVVRIRFNQP